MVSDALPIDTAHIPRREDYITSGPSKYLRVLYNPAIAATCTGIETMDSWRQADCAVNAGWMVSDRSSATCTNIGGCSYGAPTTPSTTAEIIVLAAESVLGMGVHQADMALQRSAVVDLTATLPTLFPAGASKGYQLGGDMLRLMDACKGGNPTPATMGLMGMSKPSTMGECESTGYSWDYSNSVCLTSNGSTTIVAATPNDCTHTGNHWFSNVILAPLQGTLLDAPGGCSQEISPTRVDGAGWLCSAIIMMSSDDDGDNWSYRGRIDWDGGDADVSGPSSVALAQLQNGEILGLVSVGSNRTLYRTTSTLDDAGAQWSTLTQTDLWSTDPSVLVLPNGATVVTSARPGLSMWVSVDVNALKFRRYALVGRATR